MANSSERSRSLGGGKVYTSDRMLPKFTITGGMDSATVEKLQGDRLGAKLTADNLMHVLWADPDYSFLLYPKTIPTAPYEALLTYLPNRDAQKNVALVDLVKTSTLAILLDQANKTQKAVKEVAQQDGYLPTKTVIFQHVGPRDMNPKTPFNTSYRPLHFHIQAYGYPFSDFPMFSEIEPIDPRSEENRSIFRDPSRRLVRDIFQAEGFSVKKQGSYSFVLDEGDINEPFSDVDAVRLQKLQTVWGQHWDRFAACLTDFNTGSNGRYIPRAQHERVSAMENLLGNEYPYLGDGSQRLLLSLAYNLQNSGNNPWKWIYNGVNGTIGYVYDYTEGKRQLVFSPRLFTSWYRHYDLVGENVIIKKDKSTSGDVYQADAFPLLDIQRRIISLLSSK